ncbi:hypothetical protein HUG10_14490 [Halorarum halophilum]|uniref:Uncharacterized protein n=1 Tax=Halorarum halophilum TaxID=2743090 RepID=A0A7D5KF27_9EURY|nr:hypothetical protein [Halobaculum halophilum]QLG28677.1 hypothetical protein HUG10_14490 [Halobaculum halophilum]
MTDEEEGQPTPQDHAEVFGPIDARALREIRDLVVELEPLVGTASLDDPVNPQTLSIDLSDGVGDASTARVDVRWSLTSNYAIHYTDERNRNFRFDRHPKPDAPARHFHPPPDAPSRPVEPSCITVSEVSLVTRAVLHRWRYAYTHGTFEGINDAENPP